jgi:hypothetical protein
LGRRGGVARGVIQIRRYKSHACEEEVKGTIFRDDAFRTTYKDLTPFIVPFAEPLATFGVKYLNIVVNKGWNNRVSVTNTRQSVRSR